MKDVLHRNVFKAYFFRDIAFDSSQVRPIARRYYETALRNRHSVYLVLSFMLFSAIDAREFVFCILIFALGAYFLCKLISRNKYRIFGEL